MNSKRAWTFGLCTAFASAGVAAGCSSDDDSSVTTTPDASTPDAGPLTDASPPAVDAGADAATTKPRVVYVESNLPTANANSILAYTQGPDGSLTALPGSPFLTGGTGVGNPTQGLGPDDGDQQIVLSADKKHLYAVNAGSDTIAVFDVKDDGSLVPITGSPFASGGVNPISIGLAGQYAVIVNQAQDPARPNVGTPQYVSLLLNADGSLGAASAPTPAGKSPQLALPTPDHALVFGLDFMAATPGPIRAFQLGATGLLTDSPTSPLPLPPLAGETAPPLALGLALHPTQKILYVGYVVRSQIGVYSYGVDGTLTYRTSVPVSGKAPCWIRVNPAGTRGYVTDTVTNSVSVLDLADPLAPAEIEHLVLQDRGPLYDAGTNNAPTSETYEEELSPDGKYLFVLSQNTNPDLSVTTGNVLHVLSVAGDGTVSETIPDVKLALGAGVRPQGVVIR